MGGKFSSKKLKFLIAGVIVLGALGYLVYAGIRDTKVYYMTPSEIIASGSASYGKGLRLGGIVQDGSIEWDPKTLTLMFVVFDQKATIPVIYKGVVPDTFKNGVEIVVEGSYSPEGIFRATTLMPKCPSKYEAVS